MPDERKESAVAFLNNALDWFAAHGVAAQRVMTDNGSAFKSQLFARAIADHGLRHKRTRPYTPKTNGKAERFIQTSIREWAYATPFNTSADRTRAMHPWLHAYNTTRPHSAHNGKPPASRIARDNVLGNDTPGCSWTWCCGWRGKGRAGGPCQRATGIGTASSSASAAGPGPGCETASSARCKAIRIPRRPQVPRRGRPGAPLSSASARTCSSLRPDSGGTWNTWVGSVERRARSEPLDGGGEQRHLGQGVACPQEAPRNPHARQMLGRLGGGMFLPGAAESLEGQRP